ncbi:DUF1350 family protein [Vulcanococcus limneticus]|uniref:DUF1350 family protein n=1 Tax=Vulcanococcus limneticus TaxID=2170428 RepID=UPI00398C0112
MRFHALHFGWAALPPQPRAVVIFLGGAFFGSFPTLFYRALLREVYEAGYGVVAIPFRFSIRHWDIALSLAIYQAELRREVAALLRADGGLSPSALEIPYAWIAHSLGSKYVALLELLSDTEEVAAATGVRSALQLEAPEQAEELARKLRLIDARAISLRNQPQVLLDPVIADLEAAIPLPFLERFFSKALKVRPSQRVTLALIQASKLFSITTILSLASRTAKRTVEQLRDLGHQPPIPVQEVNLANPTPLVGRHLALLGFRAIDPSLRASILATLEAARPSHGR